MVYPLPGEDAQPHEGSREAAEENSFRVACTPRLGTRRLEARADSSYACRHVMEAVQNFPILEALDPACRPCSAGINKVSVVLQR